MASPLRFLFAGGGSGGSATPVIAVAERLRELAPTADLVMVGTRDGPERSLADMAGLRFVGISSGRFRRYWSRQNLSDPFRVLLGLIQSVKLIRSYRPSAGLGAGGFASVPPLLAASLLGVPVHIHQQDVEPGLANRLLAPFAHACSVSLQSSLEHFPLDRTTLAGNPVRSSILRGSGGRAIERFGLEPDRPLLLVAGGGTGALSLNQLIVEAAPRLVEHCQIVHLTGQGRGISPPAPIPGYRQVEFVTDDMADLLAAAKLVLSRAGMGTLSELAALRKPAVLVPMPESHQRANAEAFGARGAALVLDQAQLTPDVLVDALLSLLSDDTRLRELSLNIGSVMPPDAADRLARSLLALAVR